MDAPAPQRHSHVPAGAGDTYDIIGEQVTFKVTQADSSGAYLLAELWSRPSPGVPLHTHPSAESFTILEGTFEFLGLAGDEPYAVKAEPGDTVFIPGGEPHGYRVVGDVPARALAVLTPGDEMESFFVEAGTLVTDGASAADPPDFGAVLAIATKHGLVFLPPPEA